ncbi:MAG: aldo/keto reductase, partial [Candidatus Binatia bacterium]
MNGSGPDRRTFLKRAGLASGGVLGIGAIFKYSTQFFLLRGAPTQADESLAAWEGATVQSYKPLGRTGWNMSDISFGAGRVSDPDVVRAALDRGINYIDTSPDYSDALSERAVGEAVEGRRDKIFIASKFCTPDGHLDKDTPVPEIINSVEQSLQRLRTDYVDLLHIHACNSLDRLEAPTFHEAFDRLKEQGKARFMGVSSHTPELETVMNRAVDSGRFDVVMVAFNFKNWPDLDGILDKAQEKGVGFVAMKTLKGAYHTVLEDFSPDERNTFTQAAFKWVNNDPRVSGLVVSFINPGQLDEYLYASG